MRIHALCVVKNEADVIAETLTAATRWCDFVYVLDNGSTDGTWSEVLRLSTANPSIIPYKQDDRPFSDDIRGDIWNEYRSHAEEGDWWCILDADEYYIDNPKEFLPQIRSRYDEVWMTIYTYLFTEKDLAAYKKNPRLFVSTSIEERLKHYVVGEYSEMRFFRHTTSTRTTVARTNLLPESPRISPNRIRMKHYMYRSPEQIQLRLETRRGPMMRGDFVHEKRANWVPGGVVMDGPAQPEDLSQSWEERVAKSSECHYDSGSGVYEDAGPWTPPKPKSKLATSNTTAQALLKRVWRARRRLWSLVKT